MCIRDSLSTDISEQRISIPTITAFYRRLKWFVGNATDKSPQLRPIRRCYTRKRSERAERRRHYHNPSPLPYTHMQAKNSYSHDYCFFSPPEMVRLARNGQIDVITTHSKLLYSEAKRPSRKASTCSQSITSPLQIYPSKKFLFQLLLLLRPPNPRYH